MIKKCLFALGVFICCVLAACGASNAEAFNEPESTRFDIVLAEAMNTRYILVDTETGVMYMYAKNGYGGGLTVMVDENGKPLLWEGE